MPCAGTAPRMARRAITVSDEVTQVVLVMLICAPVAEADSPSRLTVSRISSSIGLTPGYIADTIQKPSASKLSIIEHSISTSEPHRTLSKQSFASDTGLLDQDRMEAPSPQRQSPGTIQPFLRAVNRTSAIPSENDEIASHTGRLQHRATLHRQDTDNLATPVLSYDQQQVGNKSWDSGFDEGEDAKERLDLGHCRKSLRGEGSASVKGRHTQMDALGRTRGWRRVSCGSSCHTAVAPD